MRSFILLSDADVIAGEGHETLPFVAPSAQVQSGVICILEDDDEFDL